jgi:aminopeptidase-like protein
LVLGLLGDPGPLHYKKSRSSNAEIDHLAMHVLRHAQCAHKTLEFTPYGYDERQFCSPGIDLPVGRLTRSPNGAYPQYHSSADDLELVTGECLAQSLDVCLQILSGLEANCTYRNTSPKGEPQLGRRGLYRKTGGQQELALAELALLWVLNLSDGAHNLLDIARRADLPLPVVAQAAAELEGCGLLVKV